MSTCQRAILRDALGERLQSPLTESEIESYEFLAERGEVDRFLKMKKGRPVIIFRLKAPKQPIKPSDSPNDDCSLSEHDARAIAGLFEEPTRRQLERWLGWGLIGA